MIEWYRGVENVPTNGAESQQLFLRGGGGKEADYQFEIAPHYTVLFEDSWNPRTLGISIGCYY
jgi:hypothetical protein